jgi:hypothetical protein
MITAKLDPIARDLRVALDEWTGPRARAEALAERAGAILAETDARNAAALGRLPDFDTFVDGLKTEQLDRVRADGVIVRVYDAMPLVLMQIGTLLWDHSPYRSGFYREHHYLLADGIEIAVVREGWSLPALPRGVNEFVFIPGATYARRLERGWSKQAPDGVYQVVGTMAKATFNRLAKISFGYRALVGAAESKVEQAARPRAPRDLRQPAIIVQPS